MLERLKTDSDRHWIARERSGLIHLAERREAIEDLRLPADRGARKASADHFSKAGDIGIDAVKPLRSRKPHSKSVITSSNISRAPTRAVSSRSISKNPGSGNKQRPYFP